MICGLHFQVGGEYGGSVESEQLGGGAGTPHIYNELYAEISEPSHPNHNGQALYSALTGPPVISPYATSASVVQAGGAGPGRRNIVINYNRNNSDEGTNHNNEPVTTRSFTSPNDSQNMADLYAQPQRKELRKKSATAIPAQLERSVRFNCVESMLSNKSIGDK